MFYSKLVPANKHALLLCIYHLLLKSVKGKITINKHAKQTLLSFSSARGGFSPAVCLKSQLTFASDAASSLLGKTLDPALRSKCPPVPSFGRRPLQLGHCEGQEHSHRSLIHHSKIIHRSSCSPTALHALCRYICFCFYSQQQYAMLSDVPLQWKSTLRVIQTQKSAHI